MPTMDLGFPEGKVHESQAPILFCLILHSCAFSGFSSAEIKKHFIQILRPRMVFLYGKGKLWLISLDFYVTKVS